MVVRLRYTKRAQRQHEPGPARGQASIPDARVLLGDGLVETTRLQERPVTAPSFSDHRAPSPGRAGGGPGEALR